MINLEATRVNPSDIQASILLEGYSTASYLENTLGHLLASPKAGLYKPTDIMPSITFNGDTYRFDPLQGTYSPVQCWDDIHGIILDANSNVVLTAAMSARKEEILTTTPMLPVVGLDLLKVIITTSVNRRMCFVKSLEWQYKKFYALFRQDPTTYGISLETLEDQLGVIKTTVNQFIGNDTWSYYFVSLRGTDILIEKGADYRICDWYDTQLKQNDHTDICSSRIHSLSVDYICH